MGFWHLHAGAGLSWGQHRYAQFKLLQQAPNDVSAQRKSHRLAVRVNVRVNVKVNVRVNVTVNVRVSLS